MRFVVFAFASLAVSCAAPLDRPSPSAMATASTPACFYTGDVTGFRVPENRVIYVGTARGETFRLDTITDCGAARSALSLGFRTLAGDRVCVGGDVDVVVPNGGAAGRCPVSRVTALAPSEAAALPAEARP